MSKSSGSEHIRNIFEERERNKESTVQNFQTIQMEGKKTVTRSIIHYNLGMIISLGLSGDEQDEQDE